MAAVACSGSSVARAVVARSGELTRPGRDVGTGADGSSGEPITLLDPTEREELVMQGSVVVVLNQHQELCALHKPGGVPVDAATLVGWKPVVHSTSLLGFRSSAHARSARAAHAR